MDYKIMLYYRIGLLKNEKASASQLLDDSFVFPEADPDAWYQNTTLIYHAAGGIDDVSYSNSREAMDATLAGGNHIVEIDFMLTKDNQVVCAHEWNSLYALEPLTLEEVQNTKYYRKYTTMTGADIVDYMQKNPDLMIVIDTKEESLPAVIDALVQVADGQSDIVDRYIIQLYDAGMKQELLEIYPFSDENFLFTSYKFGASRVEEIVQLCVNEQIRIITVSHNAWDNETVAYFRNMGITIFEHTVNDVTDAKKALARGIQGVYTDFLQPSDLIPLKWPD